MNEREAFFEWFGNHAFDPEIDECQAEAFAAGAAWQAARASAVPEWQPIETAPKDKFLLLACPSGYTTTPWVFTTGIMCSDYHAGRWIDHANDDLTDWGMEPKFWMPLPAAPKEH